MGRRGKPFTKVASSHLTTGAAAIADADKPYGYRMTAYGGSKGLKDRERPTRYQQNNLHVDIHGILFAIVAVVFVIYPLAQYFLGL